MSNETKLSVVSAETPVELNPEQKSSLAGYEAKIREGQNAFMVMATAFYAIGQENLFYPRYENLTAYGLGEWDFDKTMTSRLRNAGEVLKELAGELNLPQNEGQCRELGKVAKGKRLDAWKKIVKAAEKSGKKITGALIETAVSRMTRKDGDGETQPSVEQVVQSGTVAAVVTVTLDQIEATVLEDAGYVLTSVGDGSYSFTANGTRAAILKDLSAWNLLEKVRALSILFAK